MKRIEITGFHIENFKGIKEIKQNGKFSKIVADNDRNKSSIYDAYIWLIIGKNSSGEAEFNIKPLDELGKTIHNLKTSVSFSFDIHTEDKVYPVLLKKVYYENWVKKRGLDVLTLQDHNVEYFYNGVPIQTKKDWNAKIESLFPVDKFMLFTDVYEFSRGKSWQEARAILIELVGGVNDSEVANTMPDIKPILEEINGIKTVDEYLKELKASRSLSNKNLEIIPIRIDEQTKKSSLNDEADIRKKISEKEEDINLCNIKLIKLEATKPDNSEIEAKNKKIIDDENAYIEGLRKQLYDLENERFLKQKKSLEAYNIRKQDVSRLISDVKNNLFTSKNMLTSYLNQFNDIQSQIKANQSKLNEQIAQFKKTEAQIQDENDFRCNACGTELSASKKEELLNSFAEKKANELHQINLAGKNTRNLLNNLNTALTEKNEQIEAEKIKISKLEKQLEALEEEYKSIVMPEQEPITDEENDLKIKIESFVYTELLPINSISENIVTEIKETRAMKEQALQELGNLERTLNNIIKEKSRIEELNKEQEDLTKVILLIDKKISIIENFGRRKIEVLEDKVNKKFNYVQFKLFHHQMNGGVREVCEALKNGVPYSDTNLGGKIIIGLDIINTLIDHYQISLPIWIDNRESLTKIPFSVNAQLISLQVVEDMELTIV